MNKLLTAINASIVMLGNAERVTKATLAELSRSLLSYVMVDGGNDNGEASYDIDAVNRTIAVLTPMNKTTACLFFSNFLPFSFDEKTCTFGKMVKQQTVRDNKLKAIIAFLDNADSDIWSWALDNVKIEKKVPKYAELITNTVKRALADEVNGLDIHEVMLAVLSADGVTITDIMVEMERAQNSIADQGVAVAA